MRKCHVCGSGAVGQTLDDVPLCALCGKVVEKATTLNPPMREEALPEDILLHSVLYSAPMKARCRCGASHGWLHGATDGFEVKCRRCGEHTLHKMTNKREQELKERLQWAINLLVEHEDAGIGTPEKFEEMFLECQQAAQKDWMERALRELASEGETPR